MCEGGSSFHRWVKEEEAAEHSAPRREDFKKVVGKAFCTAV